MNQNYQTLIDRLVDVRKAPTRPGILQAHRAKVCPVCDSDKGMPLCICETDSGMILRHCHACGCSVDELASAVGMNPADFFPPRGGVAEHHARGNGGPVFWAGAASAADALTNAAIDLATGGGSVFDVMEKAEAFKRAARAAMRAEAGRKEASYECV